MHKFNSQKCSKNLKTPIIVPKPDMTSLKTSQDISLVKIFIPFYVEHWCHKSAQMPLSFIIGVMYGTIFHKNCLAKALLLKSS